MQDILKYMNMNGDFEITIFTDDVIYNKSVQEWPICDCFLCLGTALGFPLNKAIDYCKLRKPFMLNNVFMQPLLLNRIVVYQKLEKIGIPTPSYVIVTRNNELKETCNFKESEDYIEVDGTRVYKPFVEKPIDGTNHNIYLYYPKSMGGGCRKLFRKTGNKSSEYDPSS